MFREEWTFVNWPKSNMGAINFREVEITKLSRQKDIRQMCSSVKQKSLITVEDKIIIDLFKKIMIFLRKIIVLNQFCQFSDWKKRKKRHELLPVK